MQNLRMVTDSDRPIEYICACCAIFPPFCVESLRSAAMLSVVEGKTLSKNVFKNMLKAPIKRRKLKQACREPRRGSCRMPTALRIMVNALVQGFG